MASLLVYVGADRLRAVLPECAAGDTWQITADTFTEPQLERLDEESWLFVVTDTRCVAVLREPRIENRRFAGGAALVCNHDITHLLPRLGCLDGNVATWAAIPRVVPPSDLDLLRYELGLPIEAEPVPPLVPDDDRTLALRAAVWDDPESDDPRLVYADYLQDRGDPRGELVGLQLGRARSGEPVSDRERLLIRRIAAACAQPLTPYLAPDFVLERGFLARCTVNDAPMPAHIVTHQAWRTVGDLTTTNVALLSLNTHLRARRLGTAGDLLGQLASRPSPLPCETIVGIAPLGKSQRGVWIGERGVAAIAGAKAFAALRVLSVNATSPPSMMLASMGAGTRVIPTILRGPLGRRLQQLDAYIETITPELQGWRDAFDAAELPLLTLRFVPLDPERFGRRAGHEVVVALRRTARAPHVIVQVDDELPADHVTILMRVVAQLARGVQYAEVHDFGGPPDRNAVLVERMRAMFQQVMAHPPSARRFAP